MENLGVRFIPTDFTPKQGYSGNKPALCFSNGTKIASCVIIDELEVKTVEFPLDVIQKSHLVVNPLGPGTPYPVERFVDRCIKCGRPRTPDADKLLALVQDGKALPPSPKKKAPSALSGRSAPSGGGKAKTTAGSDLIRALATEMKIPSPKLRRFLRAQGLRAPYTDEKQLRKTLSTYGKEKPSVKTKAQPAAKAPVKAKGKKKAGKKRK